MSTHREVRKLTVARDFLRRKFAWPSSDGRGRLKIVSSAPRRTRAPVCEQTAVVERRHAHAHTKINSWNGQRWFGMWASEGSFSGRVTTVDCSRNGQKHFSRVGKWWNLHSTHSELEKKLFFAKSFIEKCQIWKSPAKIPCHPGRSKAPCHPLPTPTVWSSYL